MSLLNTKTFAAILKTINGSIREPAVASTARALVNEHGEVVLSALSRNLAPTPALSGTLCSAILVVSNGVIDWSLGTAFYNPPNTQLSFTNLVEGKVISVLLVGSVTGLTWPADIHWDGGTSPILNASQSPENIIEFRRINGITYGRLIISVPVIQA